MNKSILDSSFEDITEAIIQGKSNPIEKQQVDEMVGEERRAEELRKHELNASDWDIVDEREIVITKKKNRKRVKPKTGMHKSVLKDGSLLIDGQRSGAIESDEDVLFKQETRDDADFAEFPSTNVTGKAIRQSSNHADNGCFSCMF